MPPISYSEAHGSQPGYYSRPTAPPAYSTKAADDAALARAIRRGEQLKAMGYGGDPAVKVCAGCQLGGHNETYNGYCRHNQPAAKRQQDYRQKAIAYAETLRQVAAMNERSSGYTRVVDYADAIASDGLRAEMLAAIDAYFP